MERVLWGWALYLVTQPVTRRASGGSMAAGSSGHGMESGTCCVCWEEFGPSRGRSGLWQKWTGAKRRIRASGIRIKQWLWGLLE